METKDQGFSIHCHHNTLVEYCYSYKGRVDSIKSDKPAHEQEIRLRLFKILPNEALLDLPSEIQKADAEWEKAYAEKRKAYAEREKADAEREKADAKWEKADAEWRKAYKEWKKADQEAFHSKWCGCSEWNGMEIVF